MGRKKTIIVNTLSNVVRSGSSVIVAFVLAPLVLGYFGKEVFGIRSFVGSIVIILNFFSYTIGLSLMKYVPEMISKKKFGTLNELIFAILPISFVLFFLLGLFLFIFPYFGLDWFNISPELQPLAKSIFQMVGIFTVFRFFGPVSFGLITGLNKFHLNNLIQYIGIAGNIVAYFYVIYTDSDLFVYLLILQSFQMAVLFIRVYYLRKFIPFKISPQFPRFGALKKTLGFNIYLIFNKISEQLMYTTDKLIIQKVMGSSSLSEYHFAARLNDMGTTILTLPLSALLPNMSEAFAKNDKNFIKNINLLGAAIYGILVIPPLLALFYFADDFIFLWLGEKLGDGIVNTIMATRLFILAQIFVGIYRIMINTLTAKGRVKELGWVTFIYSLINVGLSYYLVQSMGIIGVVIPTVLFWVIIYPITLAYVMKDEAFFTAKEYFLFIYPSLITILMVFVFTYFFDIDASNFFALIWKGLLLYISIVLFYFILVPNKIKKPFIIRIVSFVKKRKL
jgi:O-antigen/teichoic acid export membrane protein